jgi:hypothetical protein
MTVDGGPTFSGPTVNGTVTVSPGTVVGHVGPSFVGLSYEKSHLLDGFFSGSNAALIAMLRLLGPAVLRIGGNSVDRTTWESAGGTITKASVDAFAACMKAAGWTAIYGVNMKTSSPSVAADEAAYATMQLGSSLYGLEIGNEIDLYTSTAQSSTWSYSIFKTQWESFASAIHAGGAGVGVALTGPASAAHYNTWTVPFASDEGSKIVLLTQHYYRANGQLSTSTLDMLLQPDPALATELKGLSSAATTGGIAHAYRCSECNSFYNGGAQGVSDEYGTALWGIDFLFTNALYGSSGVNFHGGGNGAGYTPIADSGGQVVGARPLFYAMLLFTQAGTGAMYATQASAQSLNFTAYSIGAADGSTTVVLVNKDATSGVQASVDAGASVGSASVMYLQASSLTATTGETLGGVEVGADGTWTPNPPYALSPAGHQVSVLVPPASAAVVRLY